MPHCYIVTADLCCTLPAVVSRRRASAVLHVAAPSHSRARHCRTVVEARTAPQRSRASAVWYTFWRHRIVAPVCILLHCRNNLATQMCVIALRRDARQADRRAQMLRLKEARPSCCVKELDVMLGDCRRCGTVHSRSGRRGMLLSIFRRRAQTNFFFSTKKHMYVLLEKKRNTFFFQAGCQ